MPRTQLRSTAMAPRALTAMGTLLPIALAMPAAPAADLTSLGYLDVTSLGAEPTGTRDSAAAIRKAVAAARDGEYVPGLLGASQPRSNSTVTICPLPAVRDAVLPDASSVSIRSPASETR